MERHLGMNKRLRVAIIHPTLGLGGAERLVVDAALALQARGHEVCLFVGQHDPRRAFAETLDGSVDVLLRGAFLPDQVFGHAKVPLAILRTGYVALRALQLGPFDVLFTDLVPHILPLLRLISRSRTVFYCHYPDFLLAPRREGIYRYYRAPLDTLEMHAMTFAHRVLVNSRFTQTKVAAAFPKLRVAPTVVYPPVECFPESPAPPREDGDLLLLSLGRYEAKKRIELGIETVAVLREFLPREVFARVRFMHAGSISRSTPGAEETFARLERRVLELNLGDHVVLRGAFEEAEKANLLSRCRAVLYTPENEHFGIVPLEAMAAARPVIAVNSGGPCETVVDGETGFLCEATPAAFADAAQRVLQDVELAASLGRAGWARARAKFSREVFGASLEVEIRKTFE
jgi:alpha-1,3/alpha-1,6-mannosyltransferase